MLGILENYHRIFSIPGLLHSIKKKKKTKTTNFCLMKINPLFGTVHYH